MSSTVYRGVLISGGWNRGVPGVLISGSWNKGVPPYTAMSSFLGVGIERFHCIQRCPHFRGEVPLYTVVFSFQGIDSTIYRGVLISGGWNRGVLLYALRYPHFKGLE